MSMVSVIIDFGSSCLRMAMFDSVGLTRDRRICCTIQSTPPRLRFWQPFANPYQGIRPAASPAKPVPKELVSEWGLPSLMWSRARAHAQGAWPVS